MSNKKSIEIFSIMAVLLTESRNHVDWGKMPVYPKETKEERRARAEREKYKAYGLTEFFYGENSIWALNQKSADRKARHRNWLKHNTDFK